MSVCHFRTATCEGKDKVGPVCRSVSVVRALRRRPSFCALRRRLVIVKHVRVVLVRSASVKQRTYIIWLTALSRQLIGGRTKDMNTDAVVNVCTTQHSLAVNPVGLRHAAAVQGTQSSADRLLAACRLLLQP